MEASQCNPNQFILGDSRLFKLHRNHYYRWNVNKAWIYACVSISDSNERTEYKEALFFSFSKVLRDLVSRLTQHPCIDIRMKLSGKYQLTLFNILFKSKLVTLAHPGEPFDATPFINRMCKQSVTKIQTAAMAPCLVNRLSRSSNTLTPLTS